MASLTYHEQKDIENIKKLRGLIKELPPFCADFFRGIEPLTSTRTRIAYAYDLRIFFDFLKTSNSQVARMGENISPLCSGTAYSYRSGRIYGIFKMSSFCEQ